MTGLKLYEIGSEMQLIEDAYDQYARDNAGDVTEFPFEDRYESLEGQRNQKLLNLGAWYKSVKSEAEAYKVEQFVLGAKRKVAENKMDWISRFINHYLKVDEKIKDSRVTLSYRKSESVKVDEDKLDMRSLSDEFKIVKVEVDKTKVKAALKDGVVFGAISLDQKHNLQIK